MMRDSEKELEGLIKETFQSELERFIRYMEQKEFSLNTISGNKRIVVYFCCSARKTAMDGCLISG